MVRLAGNLVEVVISGSAFWLFLVDTFTAKAPFVKPRLFRDRNFAASMIFAFLVGVVFFAPVALLPLYRQDLMGYPILTAGFLAPRGIGTLPCDDGRGPTDRALNTRLLLAIRLGFTARAMWDMTGCTPDVSELTVAVNGIIQGAGMGFLLVPLSVITLATLAPEQRTEGAGFYNLSRNIGSSIGTSIVSALLVTNTQANHADISCYVSAVNRLFENPKIAHLWSPYTAAGRALDAAITTQAQIIAYIDDFKLLMILTLVARPLVLFFRKPPRGTGPEPAAPAH